MQVTRLLACGLVFTAACSHVKGEQVPVAAISEGGVRGPAEAYLLADVELFLSEGDAQAIDALNRRHVAQERLRQLPATSEEVLGGLSARDSGARDAALIAVLARGSVTEAEMSIVLSRYSVEDSFFVRYHSMQVLAMADPDIALRHADDISSAVVREGSDAIRRVALTLSTKLASAERMRIMVALVQTGSPSLARDTYAAAWSLGRDVGCALRAAVFQSGEVNGSEVLARVEKLGGLSYFALPDAGCASQMGR